jgi:hypothetical protein
VTGYDGEVVTLTDGEVVPARAHSFVLPTPPSALLQELHLMQKLIEEVSELEWKRLQERKR